MVYAKAVLKCLTTGQFLDRALGIHALLNKDHDSPRVLTGSHRVSLCLLIWGGGVGGWGGLGTAILWHCPANTKLCLAPVSSHSHVCDTQICTQVS